MAGEFFIELNLFVFSKEAGRINGAVGSEDPISKKEMGFLLWFLFFSENLSGIFQGRIDSRRKETK
jgi:hypothetical protein